MTFIVIGYQPECPKNVRKKLLTFGLTPGTELEIVRKAPMGDPIEIKLRGFLLSIRKTEYDMLVLKSKGCVHCHGCGI